MNHTNIDHGVAQRLLASVPPRPRRRLDKWDHMSLVGVIALSFVSGMLAVAGFAWWALIPAAATVAVMWRWIFVREHRPNEPRLPAVSVITALVVVWTGIPIWRGIIDDAVLDVPRAIIVVALAPVAWLVYYVILLARR